MQITGTDGNVHEEESINMTCTSTGGHPTPWLKIKRGGTVLKQGPGSSSISYTFGLSVADSGALYVCDATTDAGTISDSLTFSVRCEYCKFFALSDTP